LLPITLCSCHVYEVVPRKAVWGKKTNQSISDGLHACKYQMGYNSTRKEYRITYKYTRWKETAHQMLIKTIAESKNPLIFYSKFDIKTLNNVLIRLSKGILAGLSNNSEYAPGLVYKCSTIPFQKNNCNTVPSVSSSQTLSFRKFHMSKAHAGQFPATHIGMEKARMQRVTKLCLP